MGKRKETEHPQTEGEKDLREGVKENILRKRDKQNQQTVPGHKGTKRKSSEV